MLLSFSYCDISFSDVNIRARGRYTAFVIRSRGQILFSRICSIMINSDGYLPKLTIIVGKTVTLDVTPDYPWSYIWLWFQGFGDRWLIIYGLISDTDFKALVIVDWLPMVLYLTVISRLWWSLTDYPWSLWQWFQGFGDRWLITYGLISDSDFKALVIVDWLPMVLYLTVISRLWWSLTDYPWSYIWLWFQGFGDRWLINYGVISDSDFKP